MKDVDFHVEPEGEGQDTTVFENFGKAAEHALSLSLSGRAVTLDVVIWSNEGAREYGGDDAVERYLEDPDASVFERYEISANCLGRVP